MVARALLRNAFECIDSAKPNWDPLAAELIYGTSEVVGNEPFRVGALSGNSFFLLCGKPGLVESRLLLRLPSAPQS